MPTVIVTTRSGDTLQLIARSGSSVMEAIRDAGVHEMLALCGGNCVCATCHVFVDPLFVSRLSPIGESEDALLSSSDHRQATSRLSCQLVMQESLDGLSVRLAPED